MKNKYCCNYKIKYKKVLFWTRFLKVVSIITMIVATVLGILMGMEYGGIKCAVVFLTIFCPAFLLVGCVMIYVNVTVEIYKIYHDNNLL